MVQAVKLDRQFKSMSKVRIGVTEQTHKYTDSGQRTGK